MPKSTTGDNIPDDLPETYSYNADGTIAYVSVTDGSQTWRQTYTWSSGKITNVSGWVLQWVG